MALHFFTKLRSAVAPDGTSVKRVTELTLASPIASRLYHFGHELLQDLGTLVDTQGEVDTSCSPTSSKATQKDKKTLIIVI